MRTSVLVFVTLVIGVSAYGEGLTPSKLDPARAEARDKVFTPWGTSQDASDSWNRLSKENVPVYKEFKGTDLSRDLYIPNPGLGYWVLGGMTEQAFWDTEREKLKIGDELVSVSVHSDENGNLEYWALWAPRKRAYLLKEKMRELGITPAKVDIDNAAQEEDERGSRLDAATLYTFSGDMAFHDSVGNVRYELTITKGQVSGNQYWRDDKEPVAKVVGGWFDWDRRRLSVLIQGADHTQAQWRSQLKQFHVDIGKRQVVCDYELYDYGRRNENSPVGPPNVLDKLDRIEHLVK